MVSAKTIEGFFEKEHQWSKELLFLRDIFQSTEFEETLKWGIPVYTIEGKNVAGMTGFKSYFGIWFYQGVFLKDHAKKLMNAQEKTKGMRQWRFDSMAEIMKDKHLILAYLEEAIENQKLEKEIKPNTKKKLIVPAEMKIRLSSDGKLKNAFEKLTPGKQREFAEYISDAKQDKTKQTRLDKITSMIMEGIGLHDKYK